MSQELGTAVMDMVEAYKSTVLAKNIDAHVALYDQDARIFDMWGDWSYDGREAWRAMVADWFGSLGDERVVVQMDDLMSRTSDDVAIAHAFVTYAAVSPEGKQLRSMHNRLTWVLQRNASSWKIVHQHTSAPVDFESMRVTLQRR
jgi:uncharacterized protein (TIGR02246 family)